MMLLSTPLSLKLADAHLFTAAKTPSNTAQTSLSPCHVQLNSLLPTATTLVSAGSNPDPQACPASCKKRERVSLAELDIAAYPGYITYFGQDGAPTGTYQLDTQWDNSSDFTNHATSDDTSSCGNGSSSSDQEEEIERETTPMSRSLCKILFCSVDEPIPVYVSPPRVRPSSEQLRGYVNQAGLAGKTRKRQCVGASRAKSRETRFDSGAADASRRLSRLTNPSEPIFQIFEDYAADSLLLGVSSYRRTKPARVCRNAKKENNVF
jgi:hypothetical protein